MTLPASVANKRLTVRLSPLNATLTKTPGRGAMVSQTRILSRCSSPLQSLCRNWGSDLQVRHKSCPFFTALAAEELVLKLHHKLEGEGYSFNHHVASACGLSSTGHGSRIPSHDAIPQSAGFAQRATLHQSTARRRGILFARPSPEFPRHCICARFLSRYSRLRPG